MSKRNWLKKELESLIAAGRGGDRLPTYSEMIRRYDVGQATIDYVIQDLAVEGKIERRPGVGLFITALAKQRSVGVIFDWDPFHSGEGIFQRLLIEKCRERILAYGQHYSFYLRMSHRGVEPVSEPPDLVQDIKAGRLEGVIVLGGGGGRLDRMLEEAQMPCVRYASFSSRKDRVGIDCRNLIEQGVSALAYSGSRRIGLVSCCGSVRGIEPGFREDLDAFSEALKRFGLEEIPGAVVERRLGKGSFSSPGGESQSDAGYLMARELFEGGEAGRLGLDGLVVMDDFQAQGVLIALEKLGLRVPHDVRMATYASSEGSPLKYQSENLILLEVGADVVVAALFLMLERWMLQGIRPSEAHRVPVTLRLPVFSPIS